MTAKTIDIHGKEYTPVSERVKLYHEDNDSEMLITTRNRIEGGYVIVEAEVKTKKGLFAGTSAVSLENARSIEKENPFEVAETSAIGRALGFANYGITDAIASADEMKRATAPIASQPHPALTKAQTTRENRQSAPVTAEEAISTSTLAYCEECGARAQYKEGVSKAGRAYKGYFCTSERGHVKWIEDEEQVSLRPRATAK